jgi:MFS family permease
MTHKFRLPHYFVKAVSQEIGELYASTAIADFAIALVLLFEPIFLYSVLRFTIPQVLMFTAAVYAFYIILIPFGAKIASRYGYYHSIALSIPFQIVYWLLLFGSQNNINLIFFAPLAYAIEKSLFWPAFHSTISRFARSEQRGREFSMLYAIVNFVHILGPVVGGLLAQKYGVRAAFMVAASIYVCSIIPLFLKREDFVPKLYQYKDTLELYKTYPTKFLGYLGFGEELIVLTIWPIYIYVIVKDYKDAGLLATIATLVATILALYVGKVTDNNNHKRVLIKIGAFFYFLVWIFRYVAISFWSVFSIDSLSRTSKDLVFIPLSTLTYERAEATHIMPYSVFFEQSLAIGKLAASIIGLVVFLLTGSFMAVFFVAALFSLLYMFI